MPFAHLALGNALMDEDHAKLETLLTRIATTADADLAPCLCEIETETRAHFAREEEMMRAADLPILHCHIAQHSMLLGEFAAGHAAAEVGDHAKLRRFLGTTLPQLIAAHIDSVDRVSAQFMASAVSREEMSCLRLPIPA